MASPKDKDKATKKKERKRLFKRAVDFVVSSKDAGLSNDQKLTFYAAFKQATEAHAKWKAWHALKDMSKTAAMKAYIDALTKAVPGWETPRSRL